MKSGKNIYDEVDENRYNKYLVILKGRDWHVEIGEKKYPVDRNDFSFTRDGEKILFDFAYITIHGVPGENGLLQGYLDMMMNFESRNPQTRKQFEHIREHMREYLAGK